MNINVLIIGSDDSFKNEFLKLNKNHNYIFENINYNNIKDYLNKFNSKKGLTLVVYENSICLKSLEPIFDKIKDIDFEICGSVETYFSDNFDFLNDDEYIGTDFISRNCYILNNVNIQYDDETINGLDIVEDLDFKLALLLNLYLQKKYIIPSFSVGDIYPCLLNFENPYIICLNINEYENNPIDYFVEYTNNNELIKLKNHSIPHDIFLTVYKRDFLKTYIGLNECQLIKYL